MSLNEPIAEDAALTWFGEWAMRSGTGRISHPVSRRRNAGAKPWDVANH